MSTLAPYLAQLATQPVWIQVAAGILAAGLACFVLTFALAIVGALLQGVGDLLTGGR